MKKIFIAILLLHSMSAFAQYGDDEKLFHFGVGTALSLPLSSLKEGTSYGAGFELQPSYTFAANIEGFLQAGVHVFAAQSSFDNDLLHVPLLAGARYKAGGFFAGAAVGYGIWTADGESSKGFMYSPQLGYDGGKLEIGAHYSSTQVTGGSLSYFGVKLFRKF